MIDEHSITVADLPTTFGWKPCNAEILSQLKKSRAHLRRLLNIILD